VSLPSAFYIREGSKFVATTLARGPWDDATQHGGPPSALLGGAIERWGDGGAAKRHVARITVDLLRPVPLAAVEVEVEPIRVGRRVDWLAASLRCDGKEVARATAVRIAVSHVDLPPPHCPPHDPPALPDTAASFGFDFFPSEVAYHRAVEGRIVEGEWGAKGPITGWMRLRVPLIEGEPISPLENMLALADAQNGLCMALDPKKFAFINADLCAYVRRPMSGEWVGFAARSTPEESGTGLVQSELFDEHGEVGRVLQCLTVARR
jgi:acyl-CoA thioesterase